MPRSVTRYHARIVFVLIVCIAFFTFLAIGSQRKNDFRQTARIFPQGVKLYRSRNHEVPRPRRSGDEVSLNDVKWSIPPIATINSTSALLSQPRQRLLLTDFSYSRGMGNQMFQLAALQEVARKHQATVVLPNSFLLRRAFRFDNILFVDESSYNNIFREYHEKIIKQKSCCSYEELNLFEADDIQLIEGYFQNFRYFHPHSMLTTKEQFQWLDGVSEMASAFLENVDIQLVLKDAKRIGGEETDQVLEVADQSSRIVVGIHVRHGFDVVFNQRNAQHGHVVAPASYYDHAISKIIAEYRDVVFIVCSDNIAWARKNFNFGKDVPHFWCPGPREVDMAILSLCDELILSTGTFSWWSAYLNKNSNKRVFYYSEWPTPGSMMHKMINKSEFFLPEWTPLV